MYVAAFFLFLRSPLTSFPLLLCPFSDFDKGAWQVARWKMLLSFIPLGPVSSLVPFLVALGDFRPLPALPFLHRLNLQMLVLLALIPLNVIVWQFACLGPKQRSNAGGCVWTCT